MNQAFFQIRPTIYLLLVVGLLSNYSCDKPPLEEDFEAKVAFRGPTTSSSNQTEMLEERMQWASFISAKIFCESEEARNEVITQLDGGNVEHIDHLIGENSYTPTFRQLFIYWADYYQGTNNQGEYPVFNQAVPPGPDFTSSDDYIDYLTVENCIELFFPNGLTEDDNPDHYSSTAHPLVYNKNENYGFKYFCGEEGDPSVINAIPSIEIDPINQSYVDAGYTVIVARPYRIEGNPICEYAEYSTIDFTLFLNR